MLFNKQVIVVYPEIYEQLAITLQHQISKQDGFDSAAWTIAHYRQNLPTLSGRSHVIFLGDGDENPYSRIYLEQIDQIVNQQGACYGFDGSKAVVFGEGKLAQASAFDALRRSLYQASKVSGGLSAGAAIGAAFFMAIPMVPLLGGLLGSLGYQLVQLVQGKRARKALRREQTKIALYQFVANELDNWFGEQDQA